MKQYRIKTEAELIDEFGEDWRDVEYKDELLTDKPLPKLTIVKDGEAVEVPLTSDESSILMEAEDIVNGARATDYGSAKESFKRIAELTNLMLSHSERELLMHDGQICDTIAIKVLMAVKIARESNKHKRDNLVDLCGYAELLNRVEE